MAILFKTVAAIIIVYYIDDSNSTSADDGQDAYSRTTNWAVIISALLVNWVNAIIWIGLREGYK